MASVVDKFQYDVRGWAIEHSVRPVTAVQKTGFSTVYEVGPLNTLYGL